MMFQPPNPLVADNEIRDPPTEAFRLNGEDPPKIFYLTPRMFIGVFD